MESDLAHRPPSGAVPAGLTYATDHIERTRGIFVSSSLRLANTGSVEFRWEYTEFINDPTRTQGSVDRILRLIARFDLS